MFLVHLVLGALIVLPVVIFGIFHIKNAYDRPNRRAVYVGYGLFATALVLLASGIVLTRLEGVIVVKDPQLRSFAYWAHVVAPLAAAWLFVLHRLAGRRIKWRIGLRWAAVAAGFAGLMLIWQAQDPRQLERRRARRRERSISSPRSPAQPAETSSPKTSWSTISTAPSATRTVTAIGR